MTGPSIVWFRDDLRLADNPALSAAVDRGEPVVGLYVLDDESPEIRPLGAASRWWLHHSLTSLDEQLAELGSVLVLRRGPAGRVLREVVEDAAAGAVYWNRRYGAERAIDADLKATLRDGGVTAESSHGSVLFEPWTVHTGDGRPFAVFTPFWRTCRNEPAPRAPLPRPDALTAPSAVPRSDDLASWRLLPTNPNWAESFSEVWVPGETAARERLAAFVGTDVGDYQRTRNEPAAGLTSRLSPRLRWGELSPFTVWHETIEGHGDGARAASAQRFLSEIGWREFAYHTLYHFPELATKNLRRQFDAFPWPPLDQEKLRAWQRGRTGVALVDAGMRELWHHGVMHNRVRMVAASFLIKNLLIDWRLGEQWFWDTLVDADPANNPFGWQWVAGSGADAAPYFRIFNPVLQREKFDPRSEYVGRWAPEYLGDDPPEPIVDIAESRKRALAAYDVMKRGGAQSAPREKAPAGEPAH